MTPPLTAPIVPKGEPTDPFEGTPYRMIRKLARGGMGQVYVVEHRELGRECVAKVVHKNLAAEPQLLERVRIEAEALGALNHPNIVSVNNFGVTFDGRPFIVMELLHGEDIGHALATGRNFTQTQVIDWVLQACSALDAAHGIGLVHRDIRPENLFLHEDPDGTLVKVLDFGVARVIPGISPDSPTPLAQPTATGVIVGTLNYASPEGMTGQRVDRRADIYSLGLVLYRLLAGRGPFDDNATDTALVSATLLEDPKPPSFYAPNRIHPELDRVVLNALRKVPNERFATMQEFATALEGVRGLRVDGAEAIDNNGDPSRTTETQTIPPLRVVNARNAQRRAVLINTALFIAILLITAVLVAITVSRVRHT